MDMIARALILLALPALAACGDAAPSREKQRPVAKGKAEPAAAAPRPREPAAPGPQEGKDAAVALRAYYTLIEAGDYRQALAMRSRQEGGAERLAANFAAYQSYRASVGPASVPVNAGDWQFAEVPVMITGTFKGGKPFASAGSVTMRRPGGASGTNGEWLVFTGS